MPNLCEYTLRAKGRKSDLECLRRAMQCYYSYDDNGECHLSFAEDMGENENNRPIEHLGFRIFNAWHTYDGKILDIYGDCAWSASACMTENGYYAEFGDKSKSITLKQASKKYNLFIEVWAYEPGCCFYEHFAYDKGEMLFEETGEYYEVWINDCDNEEDVYEEIRRFAPNASLEEIKEAVEERGDDYIEVFDGKISTFEDFCCFEI